MIKCFVGFDPREAICYHTFCQSVLQHASVPVSFSPLYQPLLNGFNGQRDGTNAFVFSRYLVPALCEYSGWAIFADGDMVVTRDIAELWKYREEYADKALAVVKHEYQTKANRKYIGSTMESPNVNYPRKNWSSVILWNCGHEANRSLTPDYVAGANGQDLHRFRWLDNNEIGELPSEWNHLVEEQGPGGAGLYHYTLGVPALKHYRDCYASWHWHGALASALECGGEDIAQMVKRSTDAVRIL